MSPHEETTLGPGEFTVGVSCGHYRAAFEQDDATGYFYLHGQEGVLYHLHIYNRTSEFTVRKTDVELIWSDTGDRCGVVILGRLRGVIGLNGDLYRPTHVMRG